MSDTKSVRLEVPKEMYAEWERYLEKGNYKTLSGLIRQSVQKEIENKGRSSEILRKLNVLEQKIDNISSAKPQKLEEEELNHKFAEKTYLKIPKGRENAITEEELLNQIKEEYFDIYGVELTVEPARYLNYLKSISELPLEYDGEKIWRKK